MRRETRREETRRQGDKETRREQSKNEASRVETHVDLLAPDAGGEVPLRFFKC